ncbi:MAG TPA: tyrosine--tRNA ligase [Polyangiaceae bacterium]|nr:tyrosine--tRNA ligase [Polyangiaceae bacterium]
MTAATPIPIPTGPEQLRMLARGTVDLSPADEFTARLNDSHKTQRPLKIKAGFDPTAPDLHLGHTVLLEKMRQFQQLGHQVTFLVGDYTALIGDPTGRNALRPPLSPEQIKVNAETYTAQCFKVLDGQRTQIEWNSQWLKQMSFHNVITLASRYNLARMLERRDFKERYENNTQIALHELLYPLMQGYDSVMMECDVELGGHDQIFNLNIGRHLMEAYGKRPQVVLTVPLLVGLDGVEKMSKSKGNHIGITDAPHDMFGKVMSISDETMLAWFPLLLGEDPDKSKNPRDEKMRLAEQIVARFHDAAAAQGTRDWWLAGRPTEDNKVVVAATGPLFKIVHSVGAADSGSDARRKIDQGGVQLNGQRWSDATQVVPPGEYELKVGKKWAAKLTVT